MHALESSNAYFLWVRVMPIFVVVGVEGEGCTCSKEPGGGGGSARSLLLKKRIKFCLKKRGGGGGAVVGFIFPYICRHKFMNPWPRIALRLKPPLFDFGAGLDGMLPLWKLTCSTIWPVWMFVSLCHVTWRAEFKPAETIWSDELVFRAVDDLNETNICRAFCKFYTPVMGAHNGGVFISSVGITLSMCLFLFWFLSECLLNCWNFCRQTWYDQVSSGA